MKTYFVADESPSYIRIQILIRNFDIQTSLCQIKITHITSRITLIVSLSELNAENLSRTQFQRNCLNTETTTEKKLYYVLRSRKDCIKINLATHH